MATLKHEWIEPFGDFPAMGDITYRHQTPDERHVFRVLLGVFPRTSASGLDVYWLE